jgi:hypothetical protein
MRADMVFALIAKTMVNRLRGRASGAWQNFTKVAPSGL